MKTKFRIEPMCDEEREDDIAAEAAREREAEHRHANRFEPRGDFLGPEDADL